MHSSSYFEHIADHKIDDKLTGRPSGNVNINERRRTWRKLYLTRILKALIVARIDINDQHS